MSLALAATGLRNSVTNFLASSRISMMLLSRAKSGARGKDATNNVTKPNWMTGKRSKVEYVRKSVVLTHPFTCHEIHQNILICLHVIMQIKKWRNENENEYC